MPEPVLLVEKKGGVATLTLNRPDQMNALSLELRWALQETLTDLRTNDDVGVVILTGAGNAFRAGLDLKEMGSANQHPADPPPNTLAQRRLMVQEPARGQLKDSLS